MKSSDIIVDAHIVVVEDDEEIIGMIGGIVEPLECKSAAY